MWSISQFNTVSLSFILNRLKSLLVLVSIPTKAEEAGERETWISVFSKISISS
jgi:hypothetical protein